MIVESKFKHIKHGVEGEDQQFRQSRFPVHLHQSEKLTQKKNVSPPAHLTQIIEYDQKMTRS